MVPRQEFFVLKTLGCGMVMAAALASMYRVTESIVGSAVVTVALGFRQGTSTSFFILLFVSEFIKVMKEKCNPGRFLGLLHIMVFMDAAETLSTARYTMAKKV